MATAVPALVGTARRQAGSVRLHDAHGAGQRAGVEPGPDLRAAVHEPDLLPRQSRFLAQHRQHGQSGIADQPGLAQVNHDVAQRLGGATGEGDCLEKMLCTLQSSRSSARMAIVLPVRVSNVLICTAVPPFGRGLPGTVRAATHLSPCCTGGCVGQHPVASLQHAPSRRSRPVSYGSRRKPLIPKVAIVPGTGYPCDYVRIYTDGQDGAVGWTAGPCRRGGAWVDGCHCSAGAAAANSRA